MASNEWFLVSSHGAVLFCIAADPGCTIKRLAEGMSLTRRTVWGIVGDLRREGMLKVRKDGRVHHYEVNLDAPLRLSFLNGLTVRDVLGNLVKQNHRPR